MNGLGYQLGKLLGTIVVTLSGISKGVYVVIALLGLCFILFYSSARTNTSQPPSSSPNYLQIGKSARVTNSSQEVNMRRTSGYQSKPKSDVVVRVPSGTIVNIVGGPANTDNLTWWYVRWGAFEGWMAEHSSGGRLLLEPA
jgi:hypothetical protein